MKVLRYNVLSRWTSKSLTGTFRAAQFVTRVGMMTSFRNPSRQADLHPGRLVAEAEHITGESLEVQRVSTALARLAYSLESEAHLNHAGAAVVRQALIGQLVTRGQQLKLIREHPEIARSSIPPPVFITGLFRTGTTFLQNLMAAHPAVRAPQLWELLSPVSPADSPEQVQELVRRADSYVDEYYRAAPRFRVIHPLDARQPEECHRLSSGTFRDDIYVLRYRVPSYAAWLRGQEMRESYQYHRSLLTGILHRRPAEHLVLKSPSHLWHLADLAKVYPGARIVRLHRDPSECLPSVCSLTAVVRAARSDAVDKQEIGQYWLEHASQPLLSARRGHAPAGTSVLDVRYVDLMNDPAATARRICEFADVPWSAAASRKIDHFLDGSSRRRRAPHRYSADEFGLDPGELRRRFAGYRATFRL